MQSWNGRGDDADNGNTAAVDELWGNGGDVGVHRCRAGVEREDEEVCELVDGFTLHSENEMSMVTQEIPLIVELDVQAVGLTDEQFFRLGQANEEFRIELSANGKLIVMPANGGTAGLRNADVNAQLVSWAQYYCTGVTFDASTMFNLPNGAKRSPDASWIASDRWESLSQNEQDGFVPLCPDFVLEIRSATDRLSILQEKMEEYLANGARLGFLIDPDARQVHVYRSDRTVERLVNPQVIKGDPELRGFVLDLKDIW